MLILIPRSMNVVCPYLHSAYSLPRNSTPFSGFWRIDHRSLEATTGGGRKGWLAEPSPSLRQHHALAQEGTSCYVANCSPLRQSDITTLSPKLRVSASNKPSFKNITRRRVEQPTISQHNDSVISYKHCACHPRRVFL